MQAAPALVLLAALCGCHKSPPPAAPEPDVAAVQEKARVEVEQARAEAKKDLKNAAKIGGTDSKDVAHAKATGAFDIAMARADGDHKVSLEKCLTLPVAEQQGCKDQAESVYQSAVDAAKAARGAREQ
jgi:hypothetical protein